MATGYNNLGINRMVTGSNSGEWGNITNDNWDRITGSISGWKEVALTGADPTHNLDTPDGSTPSSSDGDGWNKVIKFTGSPSGTPVITIKHGSAKSPRLYFMENATGVAITIKYASSTGVSLAAGLSTVVNGDGTEIFKTLADFDGNAATATALATARAINGVDFDGTGAITVTAAAGTLTGTELKSTVVTSSLTATGTVATGTWGSDITMGSGDNLEVSGGTIKLDGNFPDDTENVFMGNLGGSSIVAGGCENTGIGDQVGRYITTGAGNTFVGHKAGESDSTAKLTGNYNVGVGRYTLNGVTTGDRNTAIGAQSGYGLVDGNYNVLLGWNCGYGNISRSKNILIGTEVGVTDTGADSILMVDHEDHATADQPLESFIYGDMANDKLNFNSSRTGSHVKIQNTNTEGTGWYFLECKSDIDGSPETEAYIRGDGDIGGTAFTTISADYADMFEWADGNPDDEDRIGLSVVLDGQGGIRIATGADAAEDVVGIVSGTACIVGNAAWNNWDGTFLKDDFGRPTDEPNPDYDESLTYVPRQERKEWAIIGLTGRVHLRKGSPANPSWRKIRDVSAVTEEWLVR